MSFGVKASTSLEVVKANNLNKCSQHKSTLSVDFVDQLNVDPLV